MTDAYTRPYGDASTTHFEKMGENPLVGSIVNVSGNRSPYMQEVPRHGPSGDVLATGGKANRGVGQDATGENAGPVFSPQTTICFPNAPEAAQTGRALRTVPSSIGNRDFWDNRYESGQAY